MEQILPGTPRWQAQPDGGAARTFANPSTGFAGPPPRTGEDLLSLYFPVSAVSMSCQWATSS